MANLILLKEDLEAYFKANKEYDGSVCAANARERLLNAVYGSLPFGVNSNKFNAYLLWLPGQWSVESQVRHCIEWVEDELAKRPKAPIIY